MELILTYTVTAVVFVGTLLASRAFFGYTLERSVRMRRERRELGDAVAQHCQWKPGLAFNTETCPICGQEWPICYIYALNHMGSHTTEELRECLIVKAMQD